MLTTSALLCSVQQTCRAQQPSPMSLPPMALREPQLDSTRHHDLRTCDVLTALRHGMHCLPHRPWGSHGLAPRPCSVHGLPYHEALMDRRPQGSCGLPERCTTSSPLFHPRHRHQLSVMSDRSRSSQESLVDSCSFCAVSFQHSLHHVE